MSAEQIEDKWFDDMIGAHKNDPAYWEEMFRLSIVEEDSLKKIIAEKEAEIAEWRNSRDGWMSTIEKVEAENMRLRKALKDTRLCLWAILLEHGPLKVSDRVALSIRAEEVYIEQYRDEQTRSHCYRAIRQVVEKMGE